MAMTLGAHSPKLDAVRALRTKAGRREAQRFAVEGATMLHEALAAGRTPEAVYATDRGLRAIDAAFAGRLADRTFVVPEKAMAKLSDLETPPGVVAVYPLSPDDLDGILSSGDPAIVLAGVADPGNAGSLLRSAEIFGIRAAIFVPDGVESHNPKVIRATMGAIFRMQLVTADADALTLGARKYGYAIVAAARDGVPLPEFTFPKRSLIAIGNERHGIAGSLGRWDFGVAIPQRGAGESLNASVAGGIIFYTFSQQFLAKFLEP